MDLHRIRYRGDKEDVERLFKDYNLEGIISTSEERQKMEESRSYINSLPTSPVRSLMRSCKI